MGAIVQFVKTMCITFLAAACGGFSLILAHSPVFGMGKSYELYLAPASSLSPIPTQDPLSDKLLAGKTAGESVRYDGQCAEELIAHFRAELLFEEEACGAVNYYLYSPMLGEGVELYGKEVNLHIAVRGNETAAGTPLIFGGY